jgi:hypothetical protein
MPNPRKLVSGCYDAHTRTVTLTFDEGYAMRVSNLTDEQAARFIARAYKEATRATREEGFDDLSHLTRN